MYIHIVSPEEELRTELWFQLPILGEIPGFRNPGMCHLPLSLSLGPLLPRANLLGQIMTLLEGSLDLDSLGEHPG